MKITTHISRKDYLKLSFALALRWVLYFDVALVVAAVVIHFFGSGASNSIFSSGPLILGFTIYMLLMVPLVLYRQAARRYSTDTRMQETIVYELDGNTLNTVGESYSIKKDISKSYKIRELKDWFLIYSNNSIATQIPKKDMTVTEISDLRELLRQVNIPGEKKLLK